MASDGPPRYMVVAIGLLLALLSLELFSLRGACPPTNLAQGAFRPKDLAASSSASSSAADHAIHAAPRVRTNWALQLTTAHEHKIYSQFGQDGILEYIFHHIGTTNKFFVEFGFDRNTYESSTANTALLYRRYGWRGLLMDGGHANPAINLHTERIYPHNILDLFHKYKVPAEPDYVSIDIDSSDIWIFKNLVTSGIWRPRVITTEYNSNFPWNATVTWPPNYNGTWQNLNKFYGAAMGAFDAVAREAGYSIVWVIAPVDIFYVRNDILEGITDVHPLSHFEKCGRVAIHEPATQAEIDMFTEYHTYQRTGSIEQAAAAAKKQMQEMGVDLTVRGF